MNFEKYALSFGVEIPFVQHLGFELMLFEDGSFANQLRPTI